MPAGTEVASGFFTLTGAGLLAGLQAAPRAELGRFFSTLHAALAISCILLVAPFHPVTADPMQASWSSFSTLSFLAGLTAALLALLFIAVMHLPLLRGGRGVVPGGRTGRWLLASALAAAAAAVVLDAVRLAGDRGPVLFAFAAAAAGLLVGIVVVAMNLGHWYLVRVQMSERHLVRYACLLGGAVSLRATLLLLSVGLYAAGAPGGWSGYLHGLAVDRGFFFWQRIFFGLMGPAVFAYMVYETARIRSTQSATGILYIAVIFVLIGEFLARYLMVQGAGPV